MAKFIAQVKTVKSSVNVVNDQLITVTLITDDIKALELTSMQGEKNVSVDIEEWGA